MVPFTNYCSPAVTIHLLVSTANHFLPLVPILRACIFFPLFSSSSPQTPYSVHKLNVRAHRCADLSLWSLEASKQRSPPQLFEFPFKLLFLSSCFVLRHTCFILFSYVVPIFTLFSIFSLCFEFDLMPRSLQIDSPTFI